MSDLIDRQAAIDAVCSVCGSTDCDGVKIGVYCPEPYAIQSLPSAEIKDKLDEAYISGYTDAESKFRELMKPQWIPVRESGCQLPPYKKEILVWVYDRHEIAYLYDDECFGNEWHMEEYSLHGEDFYDVQAWCELPEPYRGESE